MSLDPNTSMQAVTLAVPNLDRSIRYYTESIGLSLFVRENGQATLGAGSLPLLHLHEVPGARPVQRARTGLYHFALLLPSRRDLALVLRHLVEERVPLAGASDHGVSEALYLTDPDGHGIEIYRDRPREEWPRDRSGALSMSTDPFNAEGVLAEVTSGRIQFAGMADGTAMGHVHLHVRNLTEAQTFYCDVLGFDLIQRYGGQALFVSAGGYHHHLGMNTWAGVGVPPPPEDASRLLLVEILVPDGASWNGVRGRLAQAQIPFEDDGHSLLVDDPSQNRLAIRTAPAPAH